MNRALRIILILLALGLIALGLTRVRFDVEVLNLLPSDVPEVKGLQLYQRHFANSRELILTIKGADAEKTEAAARSLAESFSQRTNLISSVTWQPPWLEHPDQAAELLGFIWLNQPPEIFSQLTNRLAESNLGTLLANARAQLATSMSPGDIAQLSYDPFGFTKLPESAQTAAPSFANGQEGFASADGTFRLMFLKSARNLTNYKYAGQWLKDIQAAITDWRAKNPTVDPEIHYTGSPAFVAEISGSMEREMTLSVFGTALIIGILFFIAHRRIKPMLWLLVLLVVILASTLAVGGVIFSNINVVSIGFAAILLGLAVDYGVVHFQEALAHPELTVPQVRRRIWPGILWAAVTTISAFLVLNFGGLPGLAQLGSLVALGVALSALTMIFFFLPPLFRDRARLKNPPVSSHSPSRPFNPARAKIIFAATIIATICATAILATGIPKIDSTADALRPQHSQAFATMDEIKIHISQNQEPLWVVVSAEDESKMAQRLSEVNDVLVSAKSNNVINSFLLPANVWPQPEHQKQNRAASLLLASRREDFKKAALTNGFSETSIGLANEIFKTWQAAAQTTGVFWPSNAMSRWIFEKFMAQTPTNFFAVGFVYPQTNSTVRLMDAVAPLKAQLPRDNVWLSGWELLGTATFDRVKSRMWFVLPPMILLVFGSLCFAFRRVQEILLSLATLLLSGLLLLTIMKLVGWNWNLLNLMALPLILGTGVDYGIFMQLALRRHNGDLQAAHLAVGRALLLCGATAATGFGSLAFSGNAGMASLGKVCAIGVTINMLISVYLLPVWWHAFAGNKIKN